MSSHKARIRERFYNNGLDAFHKYEILELILSYSITRKDTKDLARKLLQKFGTISNIFNANIEQLLEIKGIGVKSAVFLKLFKDVSSYHLKEKILNSNYFKKTEDVYNYFKMYFKGKKFEEFHVLYLNTKNMIIKDECLFTGIQNQIHVYVKKIMKNVVLNHANSIIIVHNHPSGMTEPSGNDLEITKKIKKSLKLIDIKLLDHIIIGDNTYESIIKRI